MIENPVDLDTSVMGFKDRQEKGYNDSGKNDQFYITE